jgi:hypothetical protein
VRSATNLDGRIFRAVETVLHGEASTDTMFRYHLRGEQVWATCEGGAVAFGTLLGQFDPTGTLSIWYQHLNQK